MGPCLTVSRGDGVFCAVVQVGAAFMSHNVALPDGKSLKFEIWDTAGQVGGSTMAYGAIYMEYMSLSDDSRCINSICRRALIAGGLKSYVHRYGQAMRQLVLAGGDCAII
jgi:GTPase SAR1 family protein